MMGVQLLGVVLIFLSVGLNIQTAESCSCLQQHSQHKFCSSKIVILAGVTGKRLPVKNQIHLFRNRMKIIQVLKGSINAKRIRYIYTDSSSCGITLEPGRYMLAVNQFKYGIEAMKCGLVIPWDRIPLKEQENFSQTYKMGCNCTISTCSGSPCCPQSVNECKWDAKSPDSVEYVCLRDSDGYCSWYWPASRIEEDEMCME